MPAQTHSLDFDARGIGVDLRAGPPDYFAVNSDLP